MAGLLALGPQACPLLKRDLALFDYLRLFYGGIDHIENLDFWQYQHSHRARLGTTKAVLACPILDGIFNGAKIDVIGKGLSGWNCINLWRGGGGHPIRL